MPGYSRATKRRSSADNTLWSKRQELLTQLRKKRGETQCPATLGPLLERKEIYLARAQLFRSGAVNLVCSPEWTVKVAEAALQEKLWGCSAAIDQAAELTDLLGQRPEEEAFSRRAFSLATAACIGSGDPADSPYRPLAPEAAPRALRAPVEAGTAPVGVRRQASSPPCLSGERA